MSERAIMAVIRTSVEPSYSVVLLLRHGERADDGVVFARDSVLTSQPFRYSRKQRLTKGFFISYG